MSETTQTRATGGRGSANLVGAASVIFGLFSWQLLISTGLVSTDVLASPRQVVHVLVDIARHGYRGTSLLEDIGATLWRCIAGFLLAAVLGILLGLWMGTSRLAAASVNYIIQFFRPLPPLSYYVLLILWFGAGNSSKVVLLFMGAFPTIATAAMAGVRQASPRRLQVARALGASGSQVFRLIVFPSALPMIFTGLRIALAGSFSSVVAAEILNASNGLGWMVFSASRFLRTDIIIFGIILLGLFGMALSRALLTLDRALVHWRGRE